MPSNGDTTRPLQANALFLRHCGEKTRSVPVQSLKNAAPSLTLFTQNRKISPDCNRCENHLFDGLHTGFLALSSHDRALVRDRTVPLQSGQVHRLEHSCQFSYQPCVPIRFGPHSVFGTVFVDLHVWVCIWVQIWVWVRPEFGCGERVKCLLLTHQRQASVAISVAMRCSPAPANRECLIGLAKN